MVPLSPFRVGITIFVLALVCPAAEAQVWTNIGPEGGNLGGIAVAPSQPATIYAFAGLTSFSAPGGGLFKTTDHGDTWHSVSAGLCDSRVMTLVVHPTDPNTVYVGTTFGGVCRSTDGGKTWSAMNTGLTADANGYPLQIRGLTIDPARPTTLNVMQLSGNFAHSVDGGATWTAGSPVFVAPVDIETAPSAPSTLYALARTGGWTIFKSTDSGASWNAVNNTLNKVGLISIDPTAPSVAYLAADTVYKTVDGGTTWTAANSGLPSVGSSGMTRIVFDPANANTLFTIVRGGGLCRSTNGGGSWVVVNATGLPSSLGLTSYATDIAMDPSAPGRMVASTFLGFYRSIDAGVTWSAANRGLTASPTSGLTLNGDAPAASAFFSTPSWNPGGADVWKIPGGSVGLSPIDSPVGGAFATVASIAVDPHDANTIYVVQGGSACVVYRTLTGGIPWTVAETGTLIGSGACGTMLIASPFTSGVLYLTISIASPGIGLYRLTSVGGMWTPATGLPPGTMNAVAASRLHPNVLYASGGNQVFKSLDSGASWTSASTGLPTDASAAAGHIAIDPTNDNIAYVAGTWGIFATTNGGITWTARTDGWPTYSGKLRSALAIAVDPTSPTTLYASAGAPVPLPSYVGITASSMADGLYKSIDSGSTWTLVPETAGYGVTDVQIDGHRAAFAATNHGVLRADLSSTISLDRTSLIFGATTTTPIATGFVSKTPPQTIRVTQTGPGPITWTATSNQPWLTVSPTSGSGSAVLSVSVQFASGITAVQNGAITISAAGATNAVGPITVRLNTMAATSSSGPTGVFDTPLDLTNGVTGSLAVTGWALDDVAVTRVRIVREPVAGEPPGLVFIGNAVQVDGARPDVVTAFPNMPRNTMAGWGYLLLSNFLPNQGNGQFSLHAIADDADGHSTDLGRKTISCANATALKPFGAIDTPGQGDVVSGVVPNFGWTLIRSGAGTNPRADVPGGGSVSVFVDGMAVGSPFGWTNRADLTALFPSGYANLTSTLAVYNLDTTTLTNGVHTIFWSVSATNGQSDGIGSRFFTVSNGAQGAAAASRAALAVAASEDAAHVTTATDPIVGRRGFDLAAPYRTYVAGDDGVVTVQAEELDRIELRVDADAGWLRTAHGAAPLPIGSHLDPDTGLFTWAPGAGFVGAYDFVFAREDAKEDVRVVLNPKGSSRVGPQIVIDAPVAGASVHGAFLLGGWAADLDAGSGTGISTVHVWAYPVAGGDPSFLGVADVGARPDVAAIYGDQFRDSGYGLIVNDLPPGTYDLAVFGWSIAKRGFLPARVVRVTVK